MRCWISEYSWMEVNKCMNRISSTWFTIIIAVVIVFKRNKLPWNIAIQEKQAHHVIFRSIKFELFKVFMNDCSI